MVQLGTFITVPFGLAILIYVGYCLYHGGIHVRAKVDGVRKMWHWTTKVESPKAYLFLNLIYTIAGLWWIVSPLIVPLIK